MARVLYLTTGRTGMLSAGLELGARLRARDHEVVFGSPRDRADTVTAAGFGFVHLTRLDALREAFDDAVTDDQRRELRRRSLDDTEVEELVDAVQPDVLLIDIELHVARIVTRSRRTPTLITIPWFSILHSPTNPPLHTSFTPDDGLRARGAWLLLWAVRIRRMLVERARRLARRDVPRPIDHSCRSRLDLLALARRRGWPLRRHTTLFEWLTPHTDTDLGILSFTLEEMEFAPVAHPRLHHVGPMVPDADPGHRPVDDRWERFVTTRDASRPLVYCALGSMWEGPGRRFLGEVIEVFRRRPEWDLVVGLGDRAEPGSFEDVPDNAVLLPWAPQVDVLRRAAAAIVHGGIGTINECVTQGVPMVAYSHGGVDANGSVARVVHHGLGVAGDRRTDGADQIEAALRRVLEDDSYRTRCQQMRRVGDAYRSAARAERVIESAAG